MTTIKSVKYSTPFSMFSIKEEKQLRMDWNAHVNQAIKLAEADLDSGLYDRNYVSSMKKNKTTKYNHYAMCVDKENRFIGYYMRNLEMVRQINFLANTDRLASIYLEQFYSTKDLFFGEFEFRNYLREVEGRGKEVTAVSLQICIDNENWREFHHQVQELFLQRFNYGCIERFRKLISLGMNGYDIICWELDNPNKNVLSMILQSIKSIKETTSTFKPELKLAI